MLVMNQLSSRCRRAIRSFRSLFDDDQQNIMYATDGNVSLNFSRKMRVFVLVFESVGGGDKSNNRKIEYSDCSRVRLLLENIIHILRKLTIFAAVSRVASSFILLKFTD